MLFRKAAGKGAAQAVRPLSAMDACMSRRNNEFDAVAGLGMRMMRAAAALRRFELNGGCPRRRPSARGAPQAARLAGPINGFPVNAKGN